MDKTHNGYTRVSFVPSFLVALSLMTDFASIYKEIGPGTRISLAKLAIEHLETTNKRFRLAIDISIWQFQIQSGQGGRNPALRTLYYRLLKLLGLGIQPMFVFDGPYKPKFKRKAKVTPNTACLDNFLTKELLNRFGFPYHDAPGEAEAECALLQKQGIVDAVLSEDVDTMMFGCSMSLRRWTAEGERSGKTPTHVTMYTAECTEKNAGLDSQAMILVALMSGGDYDSEGLTKCGPKLACEAARAGFGRELCQLAKDDVEGWRRWRERLQHQLRTNEKKIFKQKHKTISIPETFPNQKVLGYYKQPVVSSPEKVARLRESIKWEMDVNIPEIRAFVAEAFNWTYLIGAKQFIKTLSPALLARKLLTRNTTDDSVACNCEAKAVTEAHYVTAIHSRRAHWNTDGCPELRISYIPANIVDLDLSMEEDIDRAEDVMEGFEADGKESDHDEMGCSAGLTKGRGPSTYDPSHPEKIWMLETTVKLGVPLIVEVWEEDMRNPKKFATRKARQKAAVSKAMKGTLHGAMDQYVKITKPSCGTGEDGGVAVKNTLSAASTPTLLAPTIPYATSAVALKALDHNLMSTGKPRPKKAISVKKSTKASRNVGTTEDATATTSPNPCAANPWTLSKRPSDTYAYVSPTRYSALGIYAPNDPESREPRLRLPNSPTQQGLAGQSPVSFLTSMANTPSRKHSRAASASSHPDRDESPQPLNNVTLRTPRQRDAIRPSPRKKQSPLEKKNFSIGGQFKTPLSAQNQSDIYLTLKTSPSIRKQKDLVDLCDVSTQEATREPLNAAKAKGKLDYTRTVTPARESSPASVNSSLPSPSVLSSSRTELVASINPPVTASPVHEPPMPPTRAKNATIRRMIMVRESLGGAWKHLEPWEVTTGKNVFTNVEVLDLTGSEGP